MFLLVTRRQVALCICFMTLAASCAKGMEKQEHAHRHAQASANLSGKSWTSQPLISQAGRGAERGSVLLGLQNSAADSLTVYGPESESRPRVVALSGNAAKITPAMPGQGGFHWVSARTESPGSLVVASTVLSFGSKGPSPQDMLAIPKEKLEIVPDPATLRYRENEQWNFRVRYLGQPWAEAELRLETENGSSLVTKTDNEGIAHIQFPMDFDPARLAKAEDPTRVQAKFVVSVAREENQQRLLTAFNGNYMPDRMRERSLAWGVGFTLLGMGLALPLLRRKEKVDV